jgi:hypothetical protein
MSLHGRLPEVTNGRFVEAKLEKPALSVGQLWRRPTGGYGSLCRDLHIDTYAHGQTMHR